jgi:putative transposase
MPYDPEIHHRRSIRLRGYDYSRPGAYFVTICTQEKRHLFGEVIEGQMMLNEAGQMAGRWWLELPRKFSTVQLDCAVVMPNHLHAIVRIPGLPPPAGPGGGAHTGAPLHRVVQWFKTMTTNDYFRHVRDNGWPSLPGKLWQRNYYEHIIGKEDELNKIREYVITNPVRWGSDRENPGAEAVDDAPWM